MLVYTYVARTHSRDVSQDRGMVIYVHRLLDETKGGLCAGRYDPLMKNLLENQLI